MDVLVRLEDAASDSPVLAHVDSLPVSSFGSATRREVVTLYGVADARTLALALAAAVESRDATTETRERRGVVRHVGVWPQRGALGDAAWRDVDGKLVTHDVDIPQAALDSRADEFLGRCGVTLRRITAGLAMPDWPEGTARAVQFSFATSGTGAGGMARIAEDRAEQWLDDLRASEADGFVVALDGEDC